MEIKILFIELVLLIMILFLVCFFLNRRSLINKNDILKKDIKWFEEQRQKAEEEQRRKAEEEQGQKAEEEQRRKAEEEQRRKAEEEQRRKAEEEQRQKAEENFNKNINNVCIAEKINCPKILYHFTDKENLDSIRTHGGLFSWRYLENNNIFIHKPGGDLLSRYLDTRFHDWSDYVRLSFCKIHPMIYRLKRCGYNLVLLKIDSRVISESTYISNKNATSNGARIVNVLDISDLNDFVDFDAINDDGYIEYGTEKYAMHQAELLIKTSVPYKYIIEIISI